MTSGPVRWHPSLNEGGGPRGTSAWLFSLAETRALPAHPPTPRDLHDLGRRTGDEARRFLARRAALRGLVARQCRIGADSVAIAYDAQGCPRVETPAGPLFCSVSARGDLAALALSGEPVGVDLEPVVPGDIPWAALAGDEAHHLRTIDPSERLDTLLAIWTVKEAYVKACGAGFLIDPATIAVSVADATVRRGATTIRLDASTLQRRSIGPVPVIAACLTLPRL